MNTIIKGVLILMLAYGGTVHAESGLSKNSGQQHSLPDKINTLKEQVLKLNRDLFILEEELLFPVNTQMSVFVSIDSGSLFEIDSVRLKVDGKVVTNYLYTDREVSALFRGGVQRLFVGNLSSGEHEVTAVFIGKGPSKRDYKRATTTLVNKTDEALFVELKIKDDVSKEQPDFSVKVWE